MRTLRFSFQRFCKSVVYLTKTMVAGRLNTVIPINAQAAAARRASSLKIDHRHRCRRRRRRRLLISSLIEDRYHHNRVSLM